MRTDADDEPACPGFRGVASRCPCGGWFATVRLSDEDLAEPSDKGARSVLDRYMAAFMQSEPSGSIELVAPGNPPLRNTPLR